MPVLGEAEGVVDRLVDAGIAITAANIVVAVC
jgi:hypothetical protein